MQRYLRDPGPEGSSKQAAKRAAQRAKLEDQELWNPAGLTGNEDHPEVQEQSIHQGIILVLIENPIVALI